MEDKKEIIEKSYGPENLSDLTLIVDNTHFKVHKAILANQSDVFSSMFTKEENIINLTGRTNHSPKNFDRFLKEIYEGHISKNINEISINILFLMDFYNVKSIIDKWDTFTIETFPKTAHLNGYMWSSFGKKDKLTSREISLSYLDLLQTCKRYKLNKALNHGINIFRTMKRVIKDDLNEDWEKIMKNFDKDLLFMIIDKQ